MEEKFREAACMGSSETVKNYLKSGVDVNSQNSVNGMTALHWAVKRGHNEIVKILMDAGAEQNIANNNGQKPFEMASSRASTSHSSDVEKDSKFVPNYLKNPVFPYGSVEQPDSAVNKPAGLPNHASKMEKISPHPSFRNGFYFQPSTSLFVQKTEFSPCGLCIIPDQIVFLVRNSVSSSSDFIEIDFDRYRAPTFEEFKTVLCDHFNIESGKSIRIRKLPHTELRSSCDIKRLTDYQMLEVGL